MVALREVCRTNKKGDMLHRFSGMGYMLNGYDDEVHYLTLAENCSVAAQEQELLPMEADTFGSMYFQSKSIDHIGDQRLEDLIQSGAAMKVLDS